jgi:hypothetical protein
VTDGPNSRLVHHWDAYNARSLRDSEVAERFVPPPYFESLLAPQHQLIIGPRGSGKTTLLRMLQRSALGKWGHRDASRVRQAISFEGIFVPADASWGYRFRENDGEVDDGAATAVAQATFTTHVLRSLSRTLLLMTSDDSAKSYAGAPLLSRGSEEIISSSLAESWMLRGSLPSFNGLRQALRHRLAALGRLTQQARRGANLTDVIAPLDWLGLDVITEVANAAEFINDHLGDDGRRWALLFDELEVAPSWIREALFASLRVPTPHLILKLALSPYPGSTFALDSAEDLPDVPREGNDYDVISLAFPRRVGVERFGRQVLDSLVRESPSLESSPEQLFGASRISTPTAQWLMTGNAYTAGSRRMRELTRYVQSDDGVRQYLEQRGMHLAELGSLDPNRRAAHLRKIAPLVALREFYSVPAQSGVRRQYRQRKTYEFYTGLDMLIAITEGSPRSLLYLFGPMLEEVSGGSSDRVSPARQGRGVADLIAAYRALLRTVPAPTAGTLLGPEPRSARRGLLDVLDRIGERCAESVYANAFVPDPVGSFIVDSHIAESGLAAIESAVNVGALVFVPDDDGLTHFGSARGKRFRLNYLLAAYHRLPLRLGRAVSLSALFGPPAVRERYRQEARLSLFSKDED